MIQVILDHLSILVIGIMIGLVIGRVVYCAFEIRNKFYNDYLKRKRPEEKLNDR